MFTGCLPQGPGSHQGRKSKSADMSSSLSCAMARWDSDDEYDGEPPESPPHAGECEFCIDLETNGSWWRGPGKSDMSNPLFAGYVRVQQEDHRFETTGVYMGNPLSQLHALVFDGGHVQPHPPSP